MNKSTCHLGVYDCSTALCYFFPRERVQIKIEFNLERFSSLLIGFFCCFRGSELRILAGWLPRSFDRCLIEVVRDFKGTSWKERKKEYLRAYALLRCVFTVMVICAFQIPFILSSRSLSACSSCGLCNDLNWTTNGKVAFGGVCWTSSFL